MDRYQINSESKIEFSAHQPRLFSRLKEDSDAIILQELNIFGNSLKEHNFIDEDPEVAAMKFFKNEIEPEIRSTYNKMEDYSKVKCINFLENFDYKKS